MENDSLEIIRAGESLLAEARSNSVIKDESVWMPVAELATLGGGVASVIPALNKATQELVFNTNGLYRLANEATGDTLKIAKNGNFWGGISLWWRWF